ncbi:hypothetical protein HA48_11040 [Pantoea wallisii]|uniref:Flagellin n=1 Tax=Pantoea wallisii TaxID=1076551 RepID=A0A1X1D914_9GAMM|nr:flagellin [Pantoea wallisii]ORM73183.1 hypothetical protein HA48_11040 [Pantoea wallisii]
MISLQTNMPALSANKQSAKSGAALSEAIRNLSSGMRINSARDDAAGQAISNRFSSQQSGLAVAQRNTGDGLSLVETAESALDEINNRLQRVRQLAVQGLNSTNSQSDSDAIQAEINLNLKEIDRLNTTSSFNGIRLLDGSAGKLGFQVGANDNEKIMLDLSAPGFDVDALGLKDLVISGISGKVTNVTTLIGLATNMAFSNPAITVNYSPAGNASQLVSSSANNRQYIQSTDTDGKPLYYLAAVSARWDTATAAGNVLISRGAPTPLYNTVSSVPARSIPAVNFQDDSGNALGSTPPATLTLDNGQYYIEQNSTYYPATLSFGSSGAITAQMSSAPSKTDSDFATPPAAVTSTPDIALSSATVNFSDASGNAISNGRLLRSGSQYVLEVDNGGGNYRYYNASVTASSDGSSNTLNVAASSASSINSFSAVNSVTGTSYITLDPANVEVRYTDTEGNSSSDVLRLDADGAYYMDVPNGTLDKTATFVSNDNTGMMMLKTLQGVGDVQIYFQAGISSTTDVSSNITTTRVSEMGTAIRLKHPDDPLATLDRAIARVDSQRTQFGAIANRLTSAQTLQSSATSAIAAARSRIQDADYATEVSNMSRQQILQQASTSLLAQANQLPQQVLKLLQG